jgi:poly(A) polymerase
MTPSSSPAQWGRVLAHVAGVLAALGAEGWIVGGCLRDALLGQPVWDVDLAVAADPHKVAERIAAWEGRRAAVVPLAHGARTHRVVLRAGARGPTLQVDVAAVNGASIVRDLARRDFTLDAMALPVTAWASLVARMGQGAPDNSDVDAFGSALIDPLGGQADLRQRRLRATSEHALLDDPTRLPRAARLAITLDLTIAADTLLLMASAGPLLAEMAPEATAMELRAIMAHPDAALALQILDSVNALIVVVPELYAQPASWSHVLATCRALESTRSDLIAYGRSNGTAVCGDSVRTWLAEALAPGRTRMATLRWAALLHEAGSEGFAPFRMAAVAGLVARRMGLGGRERAIITVCAAHVEDARALAHRDADDVAIRRYFAAAGEAGAEALLIAAACERARGQGGGIRDVVAHLLCRYLTDHSSMIPPPLIDGAELIHASGRTPGRWVGVVLARVRAAQIEGEVTDHDAALALAQRLAATVAG